MPTFWEQVEDQLRAPLSERARKYLELQGAPRFWQQAPAGLERGNIVRNAAQIAQRLRQAGYETAETVSEAEPQARPGIADPRWSLWRDLRVAAGESSPWQPLVLRRVFDVSTGPSGLVADRVEVSFDHRLSRAAVVASLEKLWPRLTEAEWIRPTRVMEERAARLVRFVCLENPPDTPWRELMAAWNQAYPKWRHDSPRDFASRFHTAEEQLTGEPRGLEWFYDTDARPENWPSSLSGIITIHVGPQGERMPGYLERYRGRKWRAATYAAALSFARIAREAQALKAQGLSPLEIYERMEGPEGAALGTPEEGAAYIEEFLLAEEASQPDPDLGTWKAE